MPSISQHNLDKLHAELDAATKELHRVRDVKHLLEARVGAFDGILDNIVQAATGQPITTDDRDRHRSGYGDVGGGYGYAVDPRMSDAEREQMARQEADRRLVGLESRVAAVVAVAQFAKAHKA